jgi:hypothetical protein
MPSYTVDFVNETNMVLTLCVYQMPNVSASGVEIVAWKTARAPAVSGYGRIEWSTGYNVIIADKMTSDGNQLYYPTQIAQTEPDRKWKVIYRDEVEQLVPDGEAPSGTIQVNNQSNEIVNAGLGMDNAALFYRPNLFTGSISSFSLDLSIRAALFESVKRGEVIPINVIAGPVNLQFPPDYTYAQLTASQSGSTIILTITYGRALPLLMASVNNEIDL